MPYYPPPTTTSSGSSTIPISLTSNLTVPDNTQYLYGKKLIVGAYSIIIQGTGELIGTT